MHLIIKSVQALKSFITLGSNDWIGKIYMLSPLMFFQMRLPCKKGIAGCVNVYDMPQISPFQPFPTPSKKNNFHFLKLISQVLVIEIIKNYSTVMNAVNILLQLSHYFIISLFQINLILQCFHWIGIPHHWRFAFIMLKFSIL